MLLSSEESLPLNCIYIRTFALYIQFWRACIRRFHSLYFVYSIQGQIFCSVVPHLCYFTAFPLPFCVLVCGSAISLWPLCFFAPCFTWMSWASLWAYVCSPSASIRLTFPFSAHKQSTTSPCTLLVSRSDPMILRRKRFPTFQRQSIALCFNHHSDSLER